MKLSKKMTALCACVVGVALLTTSAFADVLIGSGYYNLKNAAKTTAAKLTNETDNFTIDIAATVKVDDKAIVESTGQTKCDVKNQATEESFKTVDNGKTEDGYTYSDKEESISRDGNTGVYYIYKKTNTGKDSVIENPFNVKGADDVEKIIDAFVGSLQDTVQVEETDGKKMYTGNLSDAQIPPLVNAISSYALKYGILDKNRSEDMGIPYPETNIYVLGASGKAIEGKDGIIESVIGSASASGTDENGAAHTYSVEFSVSITDINNTTVAKPDLEGEDVEYSTSGFELSEKYVGKYKNDIVKQEDNSFVKCGERIFEITSVENGVMAGKYYEVYNNGYQPNTKREFEFSTKVTKGDYFNSFTYTENGEEKTGIIEESGKQNLMVSLDIEMNDDGGYRTKDSSKNFDETFIRVFE
ncbi:MAG: hypothetical protein Q8882_05545 [Bacillota bacterium]|nr:hypothetical protein [Bacillota bacterium]